MSASRLVQVLWRLDELSEQELQDVSNRCRKLVQERQSQREQLHPRHHPGSVQENHDYRRHMRLVVVESPYASNSPAGVERNLRYARACMADSLSRGEAPLASHLLYTQPEVLDDLAPAERALGIDAGFAWGAHADAVAFYTDLGLSPGMEKALAHWVDQGKWIEYRNIGWTE